MSIVKSENLKAWTAGHRPTWSIVSGLMRTKISQVAATIPLIGHAIIWSDKFGEWAKFPHGLENLAMFTPYAPLHLLFFGAILLTSAWGIFRLRCPEEVRRHHNEIDFLLEMATLGNPGHSSGYRPLVKQHMIIEMDDNRVTRAEWKSTTPFTLAGDMDIARAMMSTISEPVLNAKAGYRLAQGIRQLAMWTSLILWLVGFVLVVLPAIDTTQMVFRRLIG